MGLLNFIKDVGEKLFGASEAKAATVDELKKELDKHGLNADGLQIAVDGDKVTVSGTAANTETAEKIALALATPWAWPRWTTSSRPPRPPRSQDVHGAEGRQPLEDRRGAIRQGQGAKNTLIFEANKPMLTSPDKIYPGQVLRIPPAA